MGPGSGGGSWKEVGGTAGVCRAVLRAAARLVPHRRRQSWLAERDGELWALWQRGRGPLALGRFAAGGCVDALRERRAGRGGVAGLGDDVRQAIRTLRRSPGTGLVTIVVLAVGVGVNTAVFSVLHAALLRPVPLEAPERLVAVDLVVRPPDGGLENAIPLSWPAYRALEESVAGRIELAGYTSRDMTLLGAGHPARVSVEIVTPSYFGVLGEEAATGRVLAPSEAPPAEAPVALLSDPLWTTRFGRDPAVLGRTIRLNEAALTVVGVMPPGFAGLTGTARAWVSMALAPTVMDAARLRRRQSHWMYAVGRLRPGVSVEGAASAVAAAGPAVAAAVSEEGGGPRARIVPFLDARVNPGARLSLLVIAGAAALLLLIACINVAGLLVARGAARRSEFAVRVALGAGRSRLVRAHLAESLLLAVLGGGAGVLGAVAGVRLLATGLPHAIGTVGSNGLRFLDAGSIGVNGPVLVFALLATTGTGLLAGAWPAVRAGRRWAGPALRGVRDGSGKGGDGWRGRAALVVAQLALAVVLLAGAGLMLGSLAHLQEVELGVGPQDLVLARYELPRGTASGEAAIFHRGLEEVLRGVPGIHSASVAQCTPVSGRCDVTLAGAVGGSGEVEDERIPASVLFVGDDYFRILGIPVVRGRTFGPEDQEDTPLSAVVSEGAARRLLAGGDPLRGRVVATIGALADPPGARVVGVVGDVRYAADLSGDPRPTIYVSYRQMPPSYMTIIADTDASVVTAAPMLRAAVATLRPDVPLSDATTLDDQIRSVTARTRVILLLLALFAGTALLLTALGISGLVSFVVTRRTRELGVRIALGATAVRVLGRVLSGAMTLAGVGLVAGLAGARWLTGSMEALLFGVEPNDPTTLAAVSAVLALVVLGAALVPGLRATRIDPITALRVD